MKIKTMPIIALICSIISSSCNSDDNIVNSPKTLKDDIENQGFVQIIQDNISDLPENVQVALAVIDNETTEYIGVYNNNGTLRGTDNSDRIFEIGSITKLFTSICLSKSIATNNATLTETLQSQFNFPLQNGSSINLLQLANHTSGLPPLPTNIDEDIDFDINDPYANYDINHLENYLQNQVILNSISGTQYEYSNLGAGILGYILSQKEEISYERLLQSQIFEPLQMANSTTLLANVDTAKLVIGRDQDGDTVPNWNFSEVSAGGGSIKSSVVDLEKFVRKNFEDDLVYNLPQSTTFDIAQGHFIGLGWHILENEGYRILSHNGGTAGYSSNLIMDKINKKAVIALSNISGLYDNPISDRINDLSTALLENISLE